MRVTSKSFDLPAVPPDEPALDLELVERTARSMLALVDEVRRLRAALDEAIAEADRAYDDTGDEESWATRSAHLRALVGARAERKA